MNGTRNEPLIGCLLGILAFGLIGASVSTYVGCAPVYGDATTISDTAVVATASDGEPRAAVVFALDHVDATKYAGWNGECPGTILDALRMRALLMSRGYAVTLLTNEQATAFRVTSACLASVASMNSGGRFVVYGSSHGGQVPDVTGNEADGKTETICLYDMQYADDMVFAMLLRAPKGVEVDLITDCCNAGSNYRAPRDFAKVMRVRTGKPSGEIVCSFTHYGGCGDGESSYGGPSGGVFTKALLSAGPGNLSRLEWFDAAKARMPRNQVPVFGELGTSVKNEKALR